MSTDGFGLQHIFYLFMNDKNRVKHHMNYYLLKTK